MVPQAKCNAFIWQHKMYDNLWLGFYMFIHSNRYLEILISTIIFTSPEREGRTEQIYFCTKCQVQGNCPYQGKKKGPWTCPRKSVSKYNNHWCPPSNPRSRRQRLRLILKGQIQPFISQSIHLSITYPPIHPPTHSTFHPCTIVLIIQQIFNKCLLCDRHSMDTATNKTD